jgi:hypothetical protein
MTSFLHTLFWLIVAHAVCDFPLQGDFLSRAKNHLLPIEGVPPWIALCAHATIQAGAVALVTGYYSLGCVEFLAHVLIDYLRCRKLFSFGADQALHIFCKFEWALVIAFYGIRP